MKVYFAYSDSYRELMKKAGVRLLFTYPGVNKALPKWWLPDAPDVIIDSGGYQVAKGINRYPLLIEAYISWLKKILKRYGDRVSFYMNLDITEKDTAENYKKMVAAGLTPVPVWKDGWSWDNLRLSCSQSELVAIGGLVGRKKKSSTYYRDLFQYVKSEFSFNRFHMLGLGVTLRVFEKDKPYSIDFSTWANTPWLGHYIDFTSTGVRELALDEETADRVRFDKGLLYQYVERSIEALQALEDE